MRVVNTDTKSHAGKPLEKCLQETDMGKKRVYLEACLQQRKKFSPFSAAVDGLLGMEVTAILNRIYSHLATNWYQPYSRTRGYVKSRIAITLVRATHE